MSLYGVFQEIILAVNSHINTNSNMKNISIFLSSSWEIMGEIMDIMIEIEFLKFIAKKYS